MPESDPLDDGRRAQYEGGVLPGRARNEGLAVQVDQLPQGLPAAMVRVAERAPVLLQVRRKRCSNP